MIGPLKLRTVTLGPDVPVSSFSSWPLPLLLATGSRLSSPLVIRPVTLVRSRLPVSGDVSWSSTVPLWLSISTIAERSSLEPRMMEPVTDSNRPCTMPRVSIVSGPLTVAAAMSSERPLAVSEPLAVRARTYGAMTSTRTAPSIASALISCAVPESSMLPLTVLKPPEMSFASIDPVTERTLTRPLRGIQATSCVPMGGFAPVASSTPNLAPAPAPPK